MFRLRKLTGHLRLLSTFSGTVKINLITCWLCILIVNSGVLAPVFSTSASNEQLCPSIPLDRQRKLFATMAEYTLNTEKGDIDAICKDIHENAICYTLKGKKEYMAGFRQHVARYPSMKYQVLDRKIGMDNYGVWTEFEFIRHWIDKNSNKEMSWNSQEEDIAERIYFNENDKIIGIFKYNINQPDFSDLSGVDFS